MSLFNTILLWQSAYMGTCPGTWKQLVWIKLTQVPVAYLTLRRPHVANGRAVSTDFQHIHNHLTWTGRTVEHRLSRWKVHVHVCTLIKVGKKTHQNGNSLYLWVVTFNVIFNSFLALCCTFQILFITPLCIRILGVGWWFYNLEKIMRCFPCKSSSPPPCPGSL